MTPKVTTKWKGTSSDWVVDGRGIKCKDNSDEEIVVRGTTLRLRATVINHVVDGIEVVMGMDVIECLVSVLEKTWFRLVPWDVMHRGSGM